MAHMPNSPDPAHEPIDPRLAAYLAKHCGPNHYGDQDENGVDLSLIRANLKLTPLERIRRGEQMRRQAEVLRRAIRVG